MTRDLERYNELFNLQRKKEDEQLRQAKFGIALKRFSATEDQKEKAHNFQITALQLEVKGLQESNDILETMVRELIGAPPMGTPKRECNKHTDCDAYDALEKARGNQPVHCHSDDCEECFPK